MKSYQIEFIRTSYTTICVDAESKEEAEILAWKKIELGTDVNDSHWDIYSTEEQA
jgi:hypothetical protein